MSVARNLAKQSAGAVAWGLFIAAAPFDLVFGACLVWAPLLVWRETIRTRRYGFWPGAACRFAIITAFFVGAVITPKHEDKLVGPISYEEMALRDLCRQLNREHGIPVRADDESAFDERVTFSTTHTMRRRDVAAELAKLTDRNMRYWGCLNGGSFLCGHDGAFHLLQK